MVRLFVTLLILGFASLVYCQLCKCRPTFRNFQCESQKECKRSLCFVNKNDPEGNEISLPATCCLPNSEPESCGEFCKCMDRIVYQEYEGNYYEVPQCTCLEVY
ncbi:uncharacterized protein LOC120338519 [Styela clava]|uniref:uncharacterized protein LOC120338519 n=1 Tax=Styela clava TaxID=7725 RepID=UPI001939EE2F|nr:uncharacterized protein LOC120338519 [Styela clava]